MDWDPGGGRELGALPEVVRVPALTRRRVVGLAVAAAGVGALLTYLVTAVPVRSATLPRSMAMDHWRVAALGAMAVAFVDGLVVSTRRRRPTTPLIVSRPGVAGRDRAWIPRPMWPERLTRRQAMLATLGCLGLAWLGLLARVPLWGMVLLAAAPWIPLAILEARWKLRHYGFFAVFGVIAILQVGHLGEHTAQVVQLLLTHGDLARSHGVFGRLDFELVHFVWDTMIWFTTCLLLWRFGSQNRWLWVAWTAASLHQVEHVYLFWMNRMDLSFYVHGGLAGILGRGGLIGSPMARPYLHFAYNACVVIPLVIAFWDQGRLACDRFVVAALPELTPLELAAATASLRRVRLGRGEAISLGSAADHLWIVTAGGLELVATPPDGDRLSFLLGPGDVFAGGQIDGSPVASAVRAQPAAELVVIDRGAIAAMSRAMAPAREPEGGAVVVATGSNGASLGSVQCHEPGGCGVERVLRSAGRQGSQTDAGLS